MLVKPKIILAVLSLAFLVSFFFFSRAVRGGVMRDADFAATVKIQERIDKSTHLRTAAFVGDLTEGSVILAGPGVSVVLVGLLTVFSVFDLRKKKIRLSGLLIPLFFGLLILLELYGKTVVHHPAPPFFMLKNPVTHLPAHYVWEEYSYPSGHAARSVFFVLVVSGLLRSYGWLRRDKPVRIMIPAVISVLYIGIVSLSKIYLGHHWISDIVGGWLLACAAGLILL